MPASSLQVASPRQAVMQQQHAAQIFSARTRKKLASQRSCAYLAVAQFRTCLWQCVGRWASGQEAGQPPEEANWFPRTSDRQPEAKPAHPVLHGERCLKQRRNGLFWSRWPSNGQHRRGLSIFAGSADRVLPFQSKAASSGEKPSVVRVSIARLRSGPHPLTPGGLPPESQLGPCAVPSSFG
jgi:hypothetical protein